jgi:hypothetical protein
MKLLSRFRAKFGAIPEMRKGSVLTTDGTIGISATGRLDAPVLRQILDALPANGVFELCCHPGYNDDDLERVATKLRTQRDVERLALLAEVPQLSPHRNTPQLIHYGELGVTGDLRRIPSSIGHERAHNESY